MCSSRVLVATVAACPPPPPYPPGGSLSRSGSEGKLYGFRGLRDVARLAGCVAYGLGCAARQASCRIGEWGVILFDGCRRGVGGAAFIDVLHVRRVERVSRAQSRGIEATVKRHSDGRRDVVEGYIICGRQASVWARVASMLGGIVCGARALLCAS